jgi:hypothetical protein
VAVTELGYVALRLCWRWGQWLGPPLTLHWRFAVCSVHMLLAPLVMGQRSFK